jgi:serine protease Do
MSQINYLGDQTDRWPGEGDPAPVEVSGEERGPGGAATRDGNVSRSMPGLVWLAATAGLILTAWYAGPLVVERYQYAATRGRVTAAYENAVANLDGQPLGQLSLAFELVAQRIRPSVVSVQARRVARNEAGVMMLPRSEVSQGSGVIMSKDGYIITNNHVIAGGEQITVKLFDRRECTAEVVGIDELTDLAVLKIDAGNLIPAEWGNSDDVNVGSLVWAMGSPYNLEQSITSGIVSAKERQGNSSVYQEYLQTDAAMNPGNSGGPLVDITGHVIGISTSIYGPQYQGISFAVPSSVAKYVYEQLIDNGRVRRSFLGVSENPQHPARRSGEMPASGFQVERIEPNSPADLAGLQTGDVIVGWNDRPIVEFDDIRRLVGRTPPNSRITLVVNRQGSDTKIDVQLVEIPDWVLADARRSRND